MATLLQEDVVGPNVPVVCSEFAFDGVSHRVFPKGDFVCPSGMGCGCMVLVFNRLWLTCVPEGSGFLPFGNVFNPGRHSSPRSSYR